MSKLPQENLTCEHKQTEYSKCLRLFYVFFVLSIIGIINLFIKSTMFPITSFDFPAEKNFGIITTLVSMLIEFIQTKIGNVIVPALLKLYIELALFLITPISIIIAIILLIILKNKRNKSKLIHEETLSR